MVELKDRVLDFINLHRKIYSIDDDFDSQIVWTTIIGLILLFGILIAITISNSNSKNNCEHLGGEYKVIDRAISGTTMIYIYGCVK